MDSCYFGFWNDCKIGYEGDDLVRCHVMKNLAIAYNGDNFDEGALTGYGANPPAAGIKVLKGPFTDGPDGIDNNRNGIIDEENERHGLSGHVYYNLGGNPRNGDPTKFTDFYNLLRGKWKDGTEITYGGSGLNLVGVNTPACKFMFPGNSDPLGFGFGGSAANPVVMPPWDEESSGNPPGNRRALLTMGPVTLEPGDFNEFTLVTLIGHGGTNLENVNHLYLLSDSLENFLTTNSKEAIQKSQIFRIYPNPASGYFSVFCPQPVQQITISDLQGRMLIQLDPNSREHHVSSLEKGIYLVTIDSNRTREIHRLMIH